MTVDEIEALIRKYISAGIAAIVIIIGPGTGTAPDGTPAEPEIRIIEPQTGSGAGDPGTATDPPSDAPADPGRTGADGRDPGQVAPADGESSTGSTDRSDDESGSGRTGSGTGSPPDTGSRSDRESDSGTGRDATDGDTDGEGDTGGGESDPRRETGSGSTRTGEDGSRSGSGTADGSASGPARDSGPAAAGSGSGAASGEGVTAAEVHGWGAPNREDDFSAGLEQWNVYDGPGHAGQGTRSPSAATVADGILTITGDSSGTTAGMAWNPGQKYGRWEGRVRAPASDPSYNALLLLWPDAEDFPVGGEIDFMEMMDHTRQATDIFIHYGADNSQVNGKVEVDGTEWHNWAVEWTPEAITAYVDGEEWYRTTDTGIFPPGPMHLCIQLDWFPEGDTPQESYMYVDWVRQYSIDETTGSGSGTGSRNGREDSTAEPGRTRDSDDSSRSDTSSSGREDDPVTRIREAIRRLFSWR